MRIRRYYPVIFLGMLFFMVLGNRIAKGKEATSLFRSPQVAKLTFETYADAPVFEANPDANSGSSSFLYVGTNASSQESQSLLKFNISSLPANAEVVTATLRLSQNINRTRAPASINIYADAILGSWSEMSVTWNSKPVHSNQGDPPTNVSSGVGWENWDVTNIVDGWVRGSLTNYGILMRGDGVTQESLFFQARENGIPAELTVAYVISTSTPTPITFTPTNTTTPPTPSPTSTSTATPSLTPSNTPTPTLPAVGSCPGTVWIYPDRDTWTDSTDPSAVHGSDTHLQLAESQGDMKQVFLHFPVQEVIPSDQNIYSAYLQMWVTDVTDFSSWYQIAPFTLNAPFDETTTNWSNQPGMRAVYGYEEETQSLHTLDVTAMVRTWMAGTDPNYGVALYPFDNEFFVTYHSRESSNEPRLAIECGSAAFTPTLSPTPTSTPTQTPTPTPTPTRTPRPTADLRPKYMEITQGIQDLDNTVRLVAGKRTFVRLYVDSGDFNFYHTNARLTVSRGGRFTHVWPINNPSGYINVGGFVTRDVVDAGFLYEVPTEFTSGTVTFSAFVDMFNEVDEKDETNNSLEATVSFEEVPTMQLKMFRVGYRDINGENYYYPDWDHPINLYWWLRRAYPISSVTLSVQNLQYEGINLWGDYIGGRPSCGAVNQILWGKWFYDITHGGLPNGMKYYGLVDDQSGFMRGCANDIPGTVASGPAGVPNPSGWGTWDLDGSYADWYGAHELGHTLGRHHAEYCGADAGSFFYIYPSGYEDYPYGGGRISPKRFDYFGETIFGFDYRPNFTVYDANWKDVMTYCDNQWISDFTYHAIMNKLQSYGNRRMRTNSVRGTSIPVDRLLINGRIDYDTGEVDIDPLFILPDVEEVKERVPGEYAIVLRDEVGDELARYPFSVVEVHPGPPNPSAPDEEDQSEFLSIFEAVPYVVDTTQVDVEGPTGVITSVVAGAAFPEITLTSPNGGENLSGEFVTVTWTASDADDDSLWFNVQYSADNGTTWQMLAENVVGNSLVVDAVNIHGSDQGRFRVWVSDGIHSASDQSDSTFIVSNSLPEIQILEPEDGKILIAGQTLGMSAFVYDADIGVMNGDQLEWSSSLDGLLGNGDQLSVADLSVGNHTIALIADDGVSKVTSDPVEVAVYADPSQLPPLPDVLKVGPDRLILESDTGLITETVFIYNGNNPDPISWEVAPSEPWVLLDKSSGSTPETITVTATTESLDPGSYSAFLTFTSPDLPGELTEVQISLEIAPNKIYLPLLSR